MSKTVVKKSARKSWKEKLNSKKQPEVKLLDFDFAGLKKGTTMLISTPLEIQEYIRQIPKGKTKTLVEIRADLAKKHRADGTCPVTTAIFTRIVAESAIEDLNQGLSKDKITPFWRVIEPESKIASKIELGKDMITELRKEENIPV